MMDVNVRAPFRLIREASAAARSSGADRSSTSRASPACARFPGIASYAVSKAAVDQLTRVAALDFAPKGVRVNAVNPGVVVTNLHRRGGMDAAKYAEFLERSKVDASPRPSRPAGGDRRPHRVSHVAGGGLDHGRDDCD